MIPPTQRFSSRAEYYLKYRPHYPQALYDTIRTECGLQPDWVIADVGSGTGFSSELFLQYGNTVYGVEPNREMRLAGESYLKSYSNFISVTGNAEATTLPDKAIDLIFVGSAHHWFDVESTRAEFLRIIKNGGWLVISGNSRVREGDLMGEINRIMKTYRIEEDTEKKYTHDREKTVRFFGNSCFREFPHPFCEMLDWEGLHGRVLSYSYAPLPGHPLYELMVTDLRKVFDRFQNEGKVTMEYNAKTSIGKLS